jgi:hypothetical protein
MSRAAKTTQYVRLEQQPLGSGLHLTHTSRIGEYKRILQASYLAKYWDLLNRS